MNKMNNGVPGTKSVLLLFLSRDSWMKIKAAIFKSILVIDGWCISYEFVLR